MVEHGVCKTLILFSTEIKKKERSILRKTLEAPEYGLEGGFAYCLSQKTYKALGSVCFFSISTIYICVYISIYFELIKKDERFS